MTRPEIILIRHGETEWNAEGRHQGHQDSPLTALGRAQARAAGRLLAERFAPLDRLAFFASPLGRTRQTAELVCEGAGLDPAVITYDDRLKEKNYGNWEGLTRPEVDLMDAGSLLAHGDDPWHHRPQGGENLEQVMHRLTAWIEGLPTDRPVVAVSHGGAGRALQRAYLGLSIQETMRLKMRQDVLLHLTPDGMTVLETKVEVPA